MFVPWLNKSFNLSTVEKFIGDISATTYWIDYLVDMATQVVLCHAGLSEHEGSSWASERSDMQDTGQLISNYKFAVGPHIVCLWECTWECMNEWMNELKEPTICGG